MCGTRASGGIRTPCRRQLDPAMHRAFTAVAMLLIGLYCVGNALWQLGRTAWFVMEAQRVPATVVDETKRSFDGIFEQLRHGNMPWDGDTAFRPHLRYVLYGRPIVDTTWPDLDNRSFVDGRQVTLLIHPQNPHQRHIDSPKFLWTGSCVLFLVGGFSLLTGWFLFKRRKKAAVTPQRAPRASAVRVAKQEQSDNISAHEGGEASAAPLNAGRDVVKKTVRRRRKKSEQVNAPDSPPQKRKRRAPGERKGSSNCRSSPRKKTKVEAQHQS